MERVGSASWPVSTRSPVIPRVDWSLHGLTYSVNWLEHQRALDGNEKTLGNGHPSTLRIVYGMAVLFDKDGEHVKALEWYQRDLDGMEKALGKDHPSTLNTIHNIALLLDKNGDHVKAQEWHKRVLNGRVKTLDMDHGSTLETVHDIAKGMNLHCTVTNVEGSQ